MGEFSDCEAQLLHEMALLSQILLVLCTPFKIAREYMWLFLFSPQSSAELHVALLCIKEIKVVLGGVRVKSYRHQIISVLL